MQSNSNITFSKKTIATLNEIIFQQTVIFCKDLDSFSSHAKRSTINIDDVRLLCRRNPKLLEKLDETYGELNKGKDPTTTLKGRGKKKLIIKNESESASENENSKTTLTLSRVATTTSKQSATSAKFAKILKLDETTAKKKRPPPIIDDFDDNDDLVDRISIVSSDMDD
ncbi:unnamed protein product [Didymodactylos carnosus]|uniref:Centromere protein S n=1 Tax=Didymodactylos carnosus TaxID=1234261 RepID=A0A813WNV5_9BILA|nr:unnamed protein product [Didymodactylos carnosus]CAF0995035.1 unnamed protein product [Didymodactylos carnosus]CAF3641110.1 unnamed protein product [Didymodactylos carnosus]CAF3764785.1 unnamed protein product [Didymodactylos carnosus]